MICVGVLLWHAKVLIGKLVVTQGFAAFVEASHLFSAQENVTPSIRVRVTATVTVMCSFLA